MQNRQRKSCRILRIAGRTFGALLTMTILAVGIIWIWLLSSLPPQETLLRPPSLHEPARIVRGQHGLVTIMAANDLDAAFALGLAHAQDRLFQMDLMRRFGAGRLSEWFGARSLDSDRFSRTLGLYIAAQKQYPKLPRDLQQVLEAYAAGVNEYISRRSGTLPLEYYFLNVRPEPWNPADSLVWGKIMDLQLTGNFRGELLRARLLRRLTADDLIVLFPPYPGDGSVALSSIRASLQEMPLDTLYAMVPPQSGPASASNNWVVDGSRSLSGKPLLANDTHLPLSTPGTWYLARIKTPDLTLTGATAPGTPFVVLGHNERIAWGSTNSMSDVDDLFIEKLDQKDPSRYQTPHGTMPFETRQEEIRVRGEPAVSLIVRTTRHGPVISDIAGSSASSVATRGHVLSLQTTWLGDDDLSPAAVWQMARARNWNEFVTSLESFVAPQQSFVYADVDGNIGLIAPGRIPIRRNHDGWLPVPGWSGEFDWDGYVPANALPRAANPAGHMIVTANNKIVPNDYPYFLSRDWEPPYRVERIVELLRQPPRQSSADSQTIQSDVLSLAATQLLPSMLKAFDGKPNSPALDMLRRWDRKMERGRAEPLIFASWLRELGRAFFAPRLGAVFSEFWEARTMAIGHILTVRQDWCDNPTTVVIESCSDQLSQSLELALKDNARRFGPDMTSWRWGNAHQANFVHPFWSRVPVLGGLFDLRTAADGGSDTVDTGIPSIRNDAAPYADVYGPTLRMVIELGEPIRTRFMIAPGQSGNPLSLHYRDLMRPWSDHEMIEFPTPIEGDAGRLP